MEPQDKPKKLGHGGARPGAGRPKGSLGKGTIAAQKKASKAIIEMLADGDPADIAECDPYVALQHVLRCHWRAGNLGGMMAAAKELMPYSRARLASIENKQALPEDMRPDPPATPDDGSMPDGGIIE